MHFRNVGVFQTARFDERLFIEDQLASLRDPRGVLARVRESQVRGAKSQNSSLFLSGAFKVRSEVLL